jgi:hypothetical protein
LNTSLAYQSISKLTLRIEAEGAKYRFLYTVGDELLEVGQWQGDDLVSFFYTGAYCGLVSFAHGEEKNKQWTDFASVRFTAHEE